jgi:type I restriction enzyme, S subunit
MSEWKEIELGKCVNMISGGTPSKDNDDYWNGDISWASAKDLKSFLLHDTQDYITKIGSQNGTKIAPKGSILILVRGMTLHNDFPICCITKDMAFNQDIKAVLPDNSLINTEYLAYWMLSSKYHLMSLVESASHGTGRINTSVLKSIKVSCPTLEEQRSIAKILGNFDRKIDNIRRQNETLEEIARSIFKHWFIDFEFPNPDGKPYKSSGGAMVRSDLGDIPEGWRVGKLGDYFTIKHGYAFKGEYITTEETNKILVTPGNFKIGGGFNDSKYKYYSNDNYSTD